MSKLNDYDGDFARLLALVEGELSAVFSRGADSGRQEFGAERLVESMRYSLGTPGKRIRPLLLLVTAEIFGANAQATLPFAVGLEMIHAYSLIHDDLPAMDDDELRRGSPTNHVVFGEGMAILAGDGLLTEAFLVMLRSSLAPERVVSVASVLARAAGHRGMVGGQAADLLAEGREPDRAILASIHRRKTGALLEAAVWAGGNIAGADVTDVAALDDFGRHFGLAFQIADDVKDQIAPEVVTGKRGGGDAESGKMTYPALFGIEGSRSLCLDEMAAADAALACINLDTDALSALARQALAPAFAKAE
jgi:geranylgeranyl diphosphate synthase type II